MNTYILFCGLPRTLDLFQRSLDVMGKIKSEGKIDEIYFSTWDSHTSNVKLCDLCKKYKVTIISNSLPSHPGFRNIRYQMKALEHGLNNINSNSYVLKTRSDFFLNYKILDIILSDIENFLLKPPGSGDIFDSKIWTVWAELTKPFYMEDCVFFGKHSDIRKMVNYNDVYETKGYGDIVNQGISHIRRYINPFLNEKLFYKFISGEIKVQHTFRQPDKFKERIQRDQSLIELIGAYYKTLYNYYRLYNEKGCAEFRLEYCSPKISLDNNCYSCNFTREKGFFFDFINCYDDRLIANLINGELNEGDEAAHKIYEFAKDFKI